MEEHSVEIFGRQNVDLKSIFNSNVKKDFERDPKFRVKVDSDHVNTIKPSIFDSNEKNITTTAERGLYSRMTGVGLVELNSVYFMNRRFGFTWKLCQMKVFEPQRLHGFQFNLGEENDDNIEVKGFQFQI